MIAEEELFWYDSRGRFEMKEKFLPLPDGEMMERRIVSGGRKEQKRNAVQGIKEYVSRAKTAANTGPGFRRACSLAAGSLRKGRTSRTEKGRTASEYEKD